MTTLAIYAIGFIAQGFFSARILLQWILSERAHRVLSPNVFWIFSLVGSVLLFGYGWLRDDFSIILGQLISYYIYIWNLNIKGVWQKIPKALRLFVIMLPMLAIVMMLHNASVFMERFLRNGAVPLPLLVFGSAGQVIFTLRFVYQWYKSYRKHESILPCGFWLISLLGSTIIVAYGIFRLDPVLIIGQSFGLVAYVRNLFLCKNQSK